MTIEKKAWFGIAFALVLGLLIGYVVNSSQIAVDKEFEAKNVEEMRAQINSELSLAVEKAELAGKYGCCIEPPCKSCFVDGGLHSRDGKICGCDKILEEGGVPCSECVKGLAEGKRHTE